MENHTRHQLVFHGNGCALPLGYHFYPGFTETFAPDGAGTSHFVSTVDLIKGEEQVLFARQSYLGGFGEITPSSVLPRVISRQGAGFSPPLCSFPNFPQNHLQFIWIHQGHQSWKREISATLAVLPPNRRCSLPGSGVAKGKGAKGGSCTPQGTRSRG